jgi:hypothetical protein
MFLASNIHPVFALDTIYIRANGSIDPPTAPISSSDNVTYFLTADIFTDSPDSGVVVERNNIVVNGAGHELRGEIDYLPTTRHGFYLNGVSNITIRNTRIDYFYSCVTIQDSSNITITACSTTSGSYSTIGINITRSSNSTIFENNIFPFLDISSSSNCVIVGNWIDGDYRSGGSHISNSSFNNITNNDFYWGLCLDMTSESKVCGNRFRAAGEGNSLIIQSSFNNTISENVASGGYGFGIGGSFNNTLSDNTLSGFYSVVSLSGSPQNLFFKNQIYGRGFYEPDFTDITIQSSSNNKLYHNNIFGVKAYSDSPTSWNDSYPSSGNYWDTYSGNDQYKGPLQNEPGSDGIGDTPYLIAPNNRDNYPLMKPYYEFDMSITSVHISRTIVPKGTSTPINVSVENQGHSPSTFNLSLEANYIYAPKTCVNSLNASFSNGWNSSIPGPIITAFQGDTIQLSLQGIDNVHHRFYVDYDNNSFPDALEPQSPDFINTTISYQFTADTMGNFTYYCAYYPGTMFGFLQVNSAPHNVTRISMQNLTLDPNEKRTVEFAWNTSNWNYGNYIFEGYAEPLLGELDISDNDRNSSIIHLGVPGDVSSIIPGIYDGTTNMRDIAYLISHFNTRPASSNWDPNADVNNDAICNMRDIAIAILNFNKHE